MPKIFISYRREDSQYQADRLHAALKPHVANPQRDIFIDIDNIPVGVDFVEHLDGQVRQCDILLALIGPNWLDVRNPKTGARRLDDPKDFVRIEIASALKRGIPVAPVLLDGAPFPPEEELPDDLKLLVRRNGAEVRRVSFDADAERMIRGLGLGAKSINLESLESSSPSGPQVPNFDPDRYAFISYPKNIAPELMRAIVRGLLAEGIPVWLFDPSPFGFSDAELTGMQWQRAGGSWERQTLEALTQAKCVLGLVGRATDKAQFQPREIALAAKSRPMVTAVVDDLPFAELPAPIRDRHTPRLTLAALDTDAMRDALTLLARDVADNVRKRRILLTVPTRARGLLTFVAFALVVAIVVIVARSLGLV